MNNLHIVDSYKIWTVKRMTTTIFSVCMGAYGTYDAETTLNRPWWTLYVEWWLHNIGYYLTKPFIRMEKLNLRFKDVDLNEWK